MTSNSEVFENGKVLGHKMHQENGSLYINFKLYYGRSLGDQRTHKMHAAQELSPTLTHKLSKSLFPLLPLKRLLGVKTDPFFHTFLNSNIHFREIKRTSSFFPSNFHHISK